MELREPGAILLISCYELGHQPLGLATAAGFLEQAGFVPRALDLAVERLDPAAVERARLVAISAPMHTALRLGLQAAREVRRINPRCHLVFYGLYAWLNGPHLLEQAADSVIGGEFEGPLVELARALDRGLDPPASVWARGRPAPPHIARLEYVPPSRAGLPDLSRYARLERDGRRLLAGAVEASRGCLRRCLHCPVPAVYGGRFFVVPRDVVLADVERLVGAGARHVTFADPDFFCGPGHAMELVRGLHSAHPDLSFDVTIKISHILAHAELFPELARAGCLFVVSAVESLSDTVLRQLEKGHTRDDVFAALEILQRAGIALRPSLLPFTPWSTLADYLELVDELARRGLIDHIDPVQLTVRLLVPPGSWLLHRPAIRRYLGPLDPAALAYTWTHPDPRMDRLQARVARIVEQAADSGEDPRRTFEQIAGAARKAAGIRAAAPPAPAPDGPRPPRLSESWFC